MNNVLFKRPLALPRMLRNLNEMLLSLRISGYKESERKVWCAFLLYISKARMLRKYYIWIATSVTCCRYITELGLVMKERGINNSSGSCLVFLKDGYASVFKTMRKVQLDPGTLPCNSPEGKYLRQRKVRIRLHVIFHHVLTVSRNFALSIFLCHICKYLVILNRFSDMYLQFPL